MNTGTSRQSLFVPFFLPFYDSGVVDIYGQFEQGLYDGLQHA